MSTKDVSCLAAPWVNSEPCGGVVVLPGALTHHVCVWLVPSPWQHWGGGREPGSAFTQLVPKQYGQAPQRSCPKPTCVVLKRHPRAGDTGHSTGGKRCLLSYKLFFSVLLALLQEPQHGAGCVQLPSWAQHLGSISPGCACPSDRLCGYINKAALCYSSVCLLGIWNKINQRRLRFAITNRSCTKLLATSSFGAQECWELCVLGGCREIRCSSQVRKRLI